MINVKRTSTMGRCRLKIPVKGRVSPDPCCPPSSLVPAACGERIIDAKAARRRYSPGVHLLASHSVPEARLAFQHEHPVSTLRKVLGECRTREPASDDDCIVGHLITPPDPMSHQAIVLPNGLGALRLSPKAVHYTSFACADRCGLKLLKQCKPVELHPMADDTAVFD